MGLRTRLNGDLEPGAGPRCHICNADADVLGLCGTHAQQAIVHAGVIQQRARTLTQVVRNADNNAYALNTAAGRRLLINDLRAAADTLEQSVNAGPNWQDTA